jgi:uncharacterized protein YndB with AHSA1/START domain
MADIFHDFPINAPAQKVFESVTTPDGLDAWWTKHSSGKPVEGTKYVLDFGPEYDWRAVVTKCVPNSAFELEIYRSVEDWQGTRVGFRLEEKNGVTHVSFYHVSWPEANAHYRQSCFCWAMYLRLLKRYVENGEVVAYEKRLEA